MPTYVHECQTCLYQWEDLFKMSEAVPEECPDCHEKGSVKRIPALCAPGKVELNQQDMKANIKAGAQQLRRDASKNENLQANLMGESNYQSLTKHQDKLFK